MIKVIGRDYLFQHPIEAVNIGIFNHWMSVGPLGLWEKGISYEKGTIEDLINSQPKIKGIPAQLSGFAVRFQYKWQSARAILRF